jgi:hypothetical protein
MSKKLMMSGYKPMLSKREVTEKLRSLNKFVRMVGQMPLVEKLKWEEKPCLNKLLILKKNFGSQI